jgi:TolB-like protein
MRRRRSIFRTTALLLAMIIASASRLPAQQHDRSLVIAALPFANNVVGDEHASLNPLVSGVPELILIELGRSPSVRTVEPARLRRVLSSQRLDPQGRIDDEGASHVGRILGAQWVIRGTFTTDGRGAIRIAALVVDVGTAQVQHSATAEGKQANLAALIGQISEKLGRDMHLPELTNEGRRVRALTQKASYQTTLSFARAIEARDAGRVQQAVTMLQQLLSDAPEYEPAQSELTRMHSDPGR